MNDIIFKILSNVLSHSLNSRKYSDLYCESYSIDASSDFFRALEALFIIDFNIYFCLNIYRTLTTENLFDYLSNLHQRRV